MKPAVISALVGAAAAGASQGALIVLDLRVSRDGITWSDAMDDATVGERIHCAIFMDSDEPGRIYGMGGATLRLRGSEVRPEDSVVFAAGTQTGRVGPFNFGAATNAIFHDSPTAFRIDAGSDAADANANAGLTFFQRDPATAAPGTFMPVGQAGSMVFAFDLVLGSADVYQMVMQLDQLSRGVASYFSASNSSRPTTTSDVRFDGASVWVNVPSPGIPAVGAMGVVAAGVRRRRGVSRGRARA